MSGSDTVTAIVCDQLDSPLGPIAIAASPEGLAALAFGPAESLLSGPGRPARDPTAVGRVTGFHPDETASRALSETRRQLEEYFEGTRTDFDVPLDWSSTTGFTREVLQAATGIRYGTVTTYAALAAAVDRPGAARAVGNALGSNPVGIVVPCHRVVRSDGDPGGYTSGQTKKTFLLRLEGSSLGALSR